MSYTNSDTTTAWYRRLGLLLLAVLCLVAVAAPLTHASGARPTAHAAKTCSPPKYPGLGYFTSMSASGTSCSSAKKLVLAYYKCRLKHGKAGRCTSKVRGYSCKETRASIPTEVDARVTCKNGSRKVVHTYQQDLQ